MNKIYTKNVLMGLLDQGEFADRVGVSRQTVNAYFNEPINNKKIGVLINDIVQAGSGLTVEQVLNLRLGDIIEILPE